MHLLLWVLCLCLPGPKIELVRSWLSLNSVLCWSKCSFCVTGHDPRLEVKCVQGSFVFVCVCTFMHVFCLGHWVWILTVWAICLTLTQQLTATPSERQKLRCVLVREIRTQRHREEDRTVFATIQYVLSPLLAHTIWSCELGSCFQGANCWQRAHTHSSHNTHSSCEPQVTPLAPSQVELWTF